MLEHRVGRTLHGDVGVGPQRADLLLDPLAEHRAEVLHQAHLVRQRLAVEALAHVVVELRERARHRVDVDGAHREAGLDGLLGDELVLPLLEHELDLVAELADAHHQLVHHAVQARVGALERGQRTAHAEEQLAADLHRGAEVLGRVLLHAEHPLAELLGAVGEDEGVHHLVGALDDDVDAAVAPRTLDMILRHVALAAHHLDGVVGGAVAELAAEHLADRGLEHDVLVMAVEEAGGHEEHRLHGVRVRRHARELLLDEVELADRAVELEAVLGPLGGLLVRELRRAQHAGAERAAAVVEAGERHVEAAAFLVEQVLLGDLHVGEADARLPGSADAALGAVAAEDLDAFHVGRADERGDRVLLLAGLGVLDPLLGHHGEQGRERAGGGPLLLAVHDVVVAAFADGAAGFLAAGVAADVRLAQAEGAQRVLGHAGEEALLLLIVAEEHERLAADRLVRGDKHRGRAAGAADAAQHAVVGRDAEAQAAVLLRDGHAEHAHVEEALDDPLRDLLLLVDLDGRVLVLQVSVELGEQLVAARAFLGGLRRVREHEVLAEVSPEDVLHEAHRLRVRAEHLLGLLDLLAVLLGDVLQVLREVGLGHGVFRARGRWFAAGGAPSGATGKRGIVGRHGAFAARRQGGCTAEQKPFLLIGR